MLENQITADERITLVALATRKLVWSGDGYNFYAAGHLRDDLPGESPPERMADMLRDPLTIVKRLITGGHLSAEDCWCLMRLAHVVDTHVGNGIIRSHDARGYEGLNSGLVTKLSMMVAAKQSAAEQDES